MGDRGGGVVTTVSVPDATAGQSSALADEEDRLVGVLTYNADA